MMRKVATIRKSKTHNHGRPQKFFLGGGKVDFLLIVFKFLTMQCKWTPTKSLTLSTPQRKCSMLRYQSQKMRFVGSNSKVYYYGFILPNK